MDIYTLADKHRRMQERRAHLERRLQAVQEREQALAAEVEALHTTLNPASASLEMDAWRLSDSGSLIGEDLGAEDLEALWRKLAGHPLGDNHLIAAWWEDKPHQIAYRLLLRLNRAERRLRLRQSETPEET
jgi:DNA repair exonuclease SbcCD ATPase subunit